LVQRGLFRLLSVFHRLQWKLTLIYTLVTVTVLSVLLVVLLVFSTQILFNMPQMGVTVAQALTGAAQNLAPVLREDPPDAAILDQWIERGFNGRAVLFVSDDSDPSAGTAFTSPAARDSAIVIIDRSGRVLTSNHPERFPAGQTFPADQSAEIAGLVVSALTSHPVEANPGMIDTRLWTTSTKFIAVAAPVFDRDGTVLGVVTLELRRPGFWEMMGYSLVSVLPSTGVLTIMAGIIGIVFGAVTARGLVIRLKKATQVTAAWGQGDFSARIQDQSRDEIGQLSADLNRMAGEFQALMQTRQELAAVDERNRLARDLHDSVKQQVFATSMNLAAAETLWEHNPAEARQRLETALALSRQSQQELTDLIQTLRPVQLEKHGLPQALENLVANWTHQNPINATYHTEGSTRTPAEVDQALFRVAQEALSNIARHSRANAASLVLTLNETLARLTIIDNGQGFDARHPQRGLGLLSMQERLHALDGSLRLESSSAGTRLEASVPVKPVKPKEAG
jgi:two-component system, NarL family, sensor histidine kinase LiaS